MIKKLRPWFFIILILVAAFYWMSKKGLSADEANQAMVQACVQNTPFDPNWPAELEKVGIRGEAEWAVQPYCECTIAGLFDQMNADEVSAFSKLTPEARIEKMGGMAAIEARNQRCLQDLKAPEHAPA
ncbi:hypothetical protein AB8Q18_09585 [Neisseriaceae bacterium CLB008]|nr:hypothetical protein [Neisseriaceae bacterium]